MLKPTEKPIACPDIVLREEFDDWAILFHHPSGDSVATGPVGVAIWKAMDGQRTLADIATEIENQFEDTPNTALDDTIAFVEELLQRKFVTIEPQTDGL